MQLKIVFGDKGEPLSITRDYRRYFISFIKGVFTKSKKFEEIYSVKTLKPFTFSVFLGNEFEMIDDVEDKKLIVNSPFNLIFSTGDMEIFSYFYNGVLQIKKENGGLKLNKKLFPIKDILLNKNTKIKSSCAIFKTVGICVLNNPEEDPKNFEKWFIVPDEENLEKFNKILQKRMLEKYEIIKGERTQTHLILTPLSKMETSVLIRQGKLSSIFKDRSIKEVYVKHYGGFLKGFKGVFILESSPWMLQFIYDFGLGVRTGQGFGLLELISEL